MWETFSRLLFSVKNFKILFQELKVKKLCKKNGVFGFSQVQYGTIIIDFNTAN